MVSNSLSVTGGSRQLRWSELYREAELYKSAVGIYTKSLFQWRKALSTSADSRTLYDFARCGLRNLAAVHQALAKESFHFRAGIARRYRFKGKSRTLYIYPWEERIVDLLLFRLLNRRLHEWISPHAYAYRHRGFGLDLCQRRLWKALSSEPRPVYVLKRDITDYFASIDHALLLSELAPLIPEEDYLFQLLRERIRFSYLEKGKRIVASRGVPFGTAIACFLANFYLKELDRQVTGIKRLHYFRYADDLLLFSSDREAALAASSAIEGALSRLKLRSNPRHHQDLRFASHSEPDGRFATVERFRHLGLEFKDCGQIALSRDKSRKVQNLFRFAFRRQNGKFRKRKNLESRIALAVQIADNTVNGGVRNVAILDYYLKHVNDEKQITLLDRWLAEEVLSLALGGGHKKGHFRKVSFRKLRAMGLPSLVHRRRLILHRKIASPFFIWRNQKMARGFQGAAARPLGQAKKALEAFSPAPEAAAEKIPREREMLPVDGGY